MFQNGPFTTANVGQFGPNGIPFGGFGQPNLQQNCNTCKTDPRYTPQPCPIPCIRKDPCPLKMYCDPSLNNTCAQRPIIDPLAPKISVTTWRVNYLVANTLRQNAVNTDADLIDPWGIVIYANSLYIVTNSSDGVVNYDLFGNVLGDTISVRDAAHNISHPTGIVVNCGTGFNVTDGNTLKSAQFLVCSEHGTVSAYNIEVNQLRTYVVINQQLTGEICVYKGLCLAGGVLYLANLFQRRIDVFDNSFNRLLNYFFIDSDSSDPIPIDFGPNNIVHIDCFLYVIWTRKDPNVTVHDLDGSGNGFVSVFNLDGSFVRRFTSRGVLNSPWAMIKAPCTCGFPPGSFLVGNQGDGRINIFDCNGLFVGPMLAASGLPIFIEGLWGLAPHYTTFNEIYFTSSANEDTLGLMGNLVADQIIQF